MPKPFAPASERNRGPILEVLQPYFADRRRVLEIGSGTGQHAVHFAAAMPQLRWQCSDRPAYLSGIRQWLGEAALPNTLEPLALDANDADEVWAALGQRQRFDAVFSANTLHIMSWPEVEHCFAQLPLLLEENAKLAVYGPFNYGGRFTSPSNAEFDAGLKADKPWRGIRDFEAVHALAEAIGFRLVEDRAMPANNRCLLWQRS